MSFYQLPNPWDPRYAIPDYVMAEPPERGTFTTQWLPRGTIPALVPDFMAKPLRQSAGRTLLGRNDAGLGSLGGDSLDAQVYELEPLAATVSHISRGDATARDAIYGSMFGGAGGVGKRTAMSGYGGSPPQSAASLARGQAKVAAYGQQVARHIIASVKTVPPANRAAVLKSTMDALDPNLHARTKVLASQLNKAGQPAPVALQNAIAHAVVQGLAGELGRMGAAAALSGTGGGRRSSSLPSSSRLPGRGRTRGMSALGAIPAAARAAAGFVGAGAAMPTASVPSTSTAPLAPIPQFTVGPVVFNLPSGTVYYPPTTARPTGAISGPEWTSGSATSLFVTYPNGPLPAAVQQLILGVIANDCSPCIETSMVDSSPNHAPGRLRDFIPTLPNTYNGDFISLSNSDPDNPIIRTQYPGTTDDGNEMAVFARIIPTDTSKPWDSTTNPYVLQLHYCYYEGSTIDQILGGLLNVIPFIVTEIIDAAVQIVTTVVGIVAGLTCALLTGPGVAGAAVANAARAPSAATVGVAAGAALATAECPPTAAPAPVVPVATTSYLMPILLLFGGGLLVMAIAKKKKRPGATPASGPPRALAPPKASAP